MSEPRKPQPQYAQCEALLSWPQLAVPVLHLPRQAPQPGSHSPHVGVCAIGTGTAAAAASNRGMLFCQWSRAGAIVPQWRCTCCVL